MQEDAVIMTKKKQVCACSVSMTTTRNRTMTCVGRGTRRVLPGKDEDESRGI